MRHINIIFLLFLICGCTNPFAPKLADINSQNNILGDQTNIDGVFKNFRYAYIFKDTLVYGNLLADDFRFTFRNYEKGVDESWGRQEDMLTTSRLFMATQNIDLVWNDIIMEIGDSLTKDISRGFNLSIIFSPTDAVNISGRVNMRLSRPSMNDIWKINNWRDESTF